MKGSLVPLLLLGLGSAPVDTPRVDRYGDALPAGAIARLGSLRLFCNVDLETVVFTPDSLLVAAVPRKGPVTYWEVATGRAAPAPANKLFVQEDAERRRRVTLETARRLRAAQPALRADDVRHALTSPDGALIATSSGEQPFRLWDGRTLKELLMWPGQKKEATYFLAFSVDGKHLAATSTYFTQIWDVGAAKLRHTLTGLGWQSFASSFSPDGKTLAVADGDVVSLWDVATGAPLHDFGHTYLVGALAFAPDGKSLISGASYTDRFIHRWDPRTGQRLATWRAHTEGVYALAVSRDGKRAISSGTDGTCRLWDFAAGRELGQIGTHTKSVWSADLAVDGRTVVTVAGDRALLWQVDRAEVVRSFSHEGQRVFQVAFAPNGKNLLTRTNKSDIVHIWDLATGAEVRRLAAPAGASFRSFDLSRDGRRLLTEGAAGTLYLWDFESGRLTRTLSVTIGAMPRSSKWANAVLAPDARMLAVGGSDGTVRLVEAASGQERVRWPGHKRGVVKLLFSPDGTLLATGSWDRTILVWDVLAVPASAPDEPGPLWADLRGDGPTSFAAMRKLLGAGDRAVALFAGHLRPAPVIDSKRIAALIADLDKDLFAARQQATQDLGKLGDAAEPALLETLKGSPSLETRLRAEALLAKIAEPSGERLQALRAVEVLERLATPAARKLLRALAAGAPGAAATREAAASLRRLGER